MLHNNREALSIGEVQIIAGISRATVYRLIKSRALVAKKIGHRTVIMRRDLSSFLDKLPEAAS